MLKRLFFIIALIGLGFGYGLLCFKLQWPPFQTIDKIYNTFKIHREPDERWQALRNINIDELLQLPDTQAIHNKHQQLIQLLWGSRDPFAVSATVSEKPIEDSRYADITSIESIHRLQHVMAFGIESNAYWFMPTSKKLKACVLVHQGHGGDFIAAKPMIKMLLDADYCVVAMSMPLLGQNNQPWVTLPNIGPLHLTAHDHLAYLNMPDGGLPIQLFIEPVMAMIHFLQAQLPSAPIDMLGLSGGGWTTLVSAAVDSRIRKSVIIAGDLPLMFRAGNARDWGDYEQMHPSLQQHVNSFQLHALGATANRKQVVIFNEFDECCYAGRAGLMFIPPIQQKLTQLHQGQLHLYIDSSHNQHQISTASRQLILQILDTTHDQAVAPIFFSKPYQPWRGL
jgi:hypothetical protein